MFHSMFLVINIRMFHTCETSRFSYVCNYKIMAITFTITVFDQHQCAMSTSAEARDHSIMRRERSYIQFHTQGVDQPGKPGKHREIFISGYHLKCGKVESKCSVRLQMFSRYHTNIENIDVFYM